MATKLLKDLKKYLYEMEYPTISGSGDRLLQPRDVAVITQDEDLADSLKSFFKLKGIPCGTIAEQVTEQHLIAVDCFENSLSFEWPIVYTYGYDHAAHQDNFGIIACSRAVAKLVNVYNGTRLFENL